MTLLDRPPAPDSPTGAAVPGAGRRPSGRSVALGLALAVLVGVVLRCWALGSRPLNFDESFEALTARRSLVELPGFLARHDTAPPLDYVFRAPFVGLGATDTMARLPSALFAVAALVLFAWWMRGRGVLGGVATVLFAVNGFLVHYGREARMYALLQLLGVVAAIVCEAWLRAPKRSHLVAIALLGFAAVLTHVEGLFLLAGLVTLAGARRDRVAWEWRTAVAVPAVAFAAAWGWALAHQVGNSHQPGARASVSAPLDVVGDIVTSNTALRSVCALAVLAGGIVLVRRHPALGRTWLACFAVPLALALVAAIRLEILLPRFFAYAAWAPLVAIAALVEVATARRTLLGVVAGVLAVLVVLPSGVDSPVYSGPAVAAVGRLRSVARPGDAVAVRPAWLGYLVEWNLGRRRPILTLDDPNAAIPHAHVTSLAGAAPTGRIWLLEPVDGAWRAPGLRPCARSWSDGISVVRCYARDPG